MDFNDKEIIGLCLAGKPDYFRFIVKKYEKPVFAFLMQKLKNRDLCFEAAQETFVRAFTNLDKLKDAQALFSWIIGIGAKVSLEVFRKQKKVIELPESDQSIPDHTTFEDGNLRLELEEIIACLPQTQRKIILLRYYENLSCKEIAEVLNLPIGTVTKYLCRAYQQIKTRLEQNQNILEATA